MKYILNYNEMFKNINEAETTTDNVNNDLTQNVINGESLVNVEKQIQEYNSKKSAIDAIYTNTNKTDDEITSDIENLLGKDVKSRNPFMVEYIKIANYKRQIAKATTDMTNDKLKITDFRQQLTDANNDTTKKAINATITDLQNKISKSNAMITSLKNDITKSENELKDKMDKLKKDLTKK